MLSIRGGMGLGDALYVQAVARHLVKQGHRVEACVRDAYRDVFAPLAGSVVCSPFRRKPIDRVAHYSSRRVVTGTTQFQDCCISAGLRETVELKLDWPTRSASLAALARPVIVVKLPQPPFDRADGYGMEFMPRRDALQRLIELLHARGAVVVQVGRGAALFPLAGIDCDLANRTTVAGAIDAVNAADAVIGFCSFMVPLAESLGKPGLFLWSRRGLQSRDPIIRQLTPAKVVHRPDLLRCVVDDCSEHELSEAVDALLDAVGCSLAA